MTRRLQSAGVALVLLLASAPAGADKPAHAPGPGHGNGHATPPGLAKKDGVPPGLAKKGGLPPGLAKKLGTHPAGPVYVALDPTRDDRAWFLVDGRWVLKQHFEPAVRVEVREARALPPIPPPQPLPSLSIDLRVVVFD